MTFFYRLFFYLLTFSCIFQTSLIAKDLPDDYLTKKIKLSFQEKSLKLYVHYPKNRAYFALRSLQIAKENFPAIHEYFDYIPQSDVHIVIGKDEETANGMAAVFPRNYIYLHDFPPTNQESLAMSSDWVKILVIHEYIHILTLEMTHGVFDFLRNFLGSTMKWSQIAPRWWSEGVAVWGESQFTSEGRLRHPWIRSYVKKLLRDKDSCQDPVCFDQPWHYPSGQFSYWLGGMFFEFLEMKERDTVACLVDNYSRGLPLFMDSTFLDCTGLTVRENFSNFREEVLKTKTIPEKWCGFKDNKFCEVIYQKYTNVNWFKGFYEDSFIRAFVIEPTKKGNFHTKKEGEKLVIFSKKRQAFKRYFLDQRIDKLYSIDTGGRKGFIVSLLRRKEDSLFREYKFYDSQMTKFISLRKQDELDSCHYLLSQKNDETTCFVYKNSRWTVQEYSYSKEKEDFDKKVIVNFPHLTNLRPTAKEKGQLRVETGSEAKQKNEKKIVVLDGIKNQSEKLLKIPGARDYSGFHYLMPEYLFFDYYVSGAASAVGVLTSMSDPLFRHNFALGGYYNFGIESDDSPYSGHAGYVYSRDNWSGGLGYQKFLIASETTDEVNTYESDYIFLSHSSYILRNIRWSKSLYYSEENELDIVSIRRKISKVSTPQAFSYSNDRITAFLQSIHLSIDPGYSQNYDYDHYFGLESQIAFKFRFSDFLRSEFESSYGKLNIDRSLRDGAIYGGGVQSFFTGGARYYPSYLIPFTNIFGKEMTQARFSLIHNTFNPYSMTKAIPFYLKKIYLLGGAEYISSDYLVNPDAETSSGSLIGNPEITSYFFGVKADFNLFYIIPLSMDWVFSVSDDEHYDYGLSIVLNASLTF